MEVLTVSVGARCCYDNYCEAEGVWGGETPGQRVTQARLLAKDAPPWL